MLVKALTGIQYLLIYRVIRIHSLRVCITLTYVIAFDITDCNCIYKNNTSSAETYLLGTTYNVYHLLHYNTLEFMKGSRDYNKQVAGKLLGTYVRITVHMYILAQQCTIAAEYTNET